MTADPVLIGSTVRQAISARWPEQAPAWLAHVVTELAELCRRYKATPLSTFDSRYGLVVEVGTDSERLVMRSSPDPDAMHQVQVSRSLASLGVGPEIHEVWATQTGVWTVASRVLPGFTLKDHPVPIGYLAPVLHLLRNQPAPDDLPSLNDWLAKRLDDGARADLPPGRTPAPLPERQRAVALLADLTRDAAQLICHGDASSKNILIGPAGRLFLIDPRGMTGDVGYDVAVAAWKTAGEESPAKRAAELAQLVGIDGARVHAWLTVAQAARV